MIIQGDIRRRAGHGEGLEAATPLTEQVDFDGGQRRPETTGQEQRQDGGTMERCASTRRFMIQRPASEHGNTAARCVVPREHDWSPRRNVPAAAAPGQTAGASDNPTCKVKAFPAGIPSRTWADRPGRPTSVGQECNKRVDVAEVYAAVSIDIGRSVGIDFRVLNDEAPQVGQGQDEGADVPEIHAPVAVEIAWTY